MIIVEIAALPNGAHRNQTWDSDVPPDGWAIIPDGMGIPESFPFVGITVDGTIVTAMTEGVMPTRPKEPDTEPDLGPSIEERVATLESSSAELAEALDMILSGVTE